MHGAVLLIIRRSWVRAPPAPPDLTWHKWPVASLCYRALSAHSAPDQQFRGLVAEWSAWVEEERADLKFAADKTTVIREAAQDRLRVLLAQAEIVRSLGASVRTAYEMAGVSG